MTISKTDLINRGVQISRRSSSDFTDALIIEALIDLSVASYALKSEETGTLAADTNTITAPTDIVENDGNSAIEAFWLDDIQYDAITFREWREGRINGYCLRNGTIYVTPKTQSARAYTLYYSKQHASSADTIEFSDKWKMAIVYKILEKIYENYELFDVSSGFGNKCQVEIDKLTPAVSISEIRRHGNLRI